MLAAGSNEQGRGDDDVRGTGRGRSAGALTAHVELWKPTGVEVVVLDQDRFTIGRGPDNDIVLAQDKMVSAHHAVLESMATGWSVQDLGSRNGTFVGDRRLVGTQALHGGDNISIGRTRLVLRETERAHVSRTQGERPPPELTRRERDVLRALCRPLFSGNAVREPASLRMIAADLVVTEAAVQQHLANLYTKFSIETVTGRSRRAALADEAIVRGAVTHAESTGGVV